MPNVKGLEPAPVLIISLNQGATLPYGPHAFVTYDAGVLTLRNLRSDVLVTVDYSVTKPRIKARLGQIDGNTVTAVNALLKPYGKVKQYWRTEEYRWHPLGGQPSPVRGRPVPAVIGAQGNLAPAAVVQPRETIKITLKPGGGKGVTMEEVVPDPEDDEITPVVSPSVSPVAVMHPATQVVIETVKRWQDRGGKRPTVKQLTQTVSAVDDVLVPTADVKRLDAMKRRRDAGQPAFAIITGPAGTAKTRLAQAWAFTHDLPVIIIEGQSIQMAGDWFGGIIPTDHGFDWVWSDAAKLIMTGQPCLIVVDELNRPENERALNGIMGLTDWKATVKPIGAPEAITLRPGQCIIATLNEGPEFVGTVEVDAAVRNRFSTGVRMGYSVEQIETRILLQQAPGIDKDVAKRLVRVAAQQRNKRDDEMQFPSHNVISTRGLVDIAQNITVGGLTPKEALWANFDSAFIPEDRPAFNAMVESQFGPDPVAAPEDDDEIEKMMDAHGL